MQEVSYAFVYLSIGVFSELFQCLLQAIYCVFSFYINKIWMMSFMRMCRT